MAQSPCMSVAVSNSADAAESCCPDFDFHRNDHDFEQEGRQQQPSFDRNMQQRRHVRGLHMLKNMDVSMREDAEGQRQGHPRRGVCHSTHPRREETTWDDSEREQEIFALYDEADGERCPSVPASPSHSGIDSDGALLRYTCKGCRKSKVRCDRVFPCQRCVRLGKKCIPHLRRNGRLNQSAPTSPCSGNDFKRSVVSKRDKDPAEYSTQQHTRQVQERGLRPKIGEDQCQPQEQDHFHQQRMHPPTHATGHVCSRHLPQSEACAPVSAFPSGNSFDISHPPSPPAPFKNTYHAHDLGPERPAGIRHTGESMDQMKEDARVAASGRPEGRQRGHGERTRQAAVRSIARDTTACNQHSVLELGHYGPCGQVDAGSKSKTKTPPPESVTSAKRDVRRSYGEKGGNRPRPIAPDGNVPLSVSFESSSQHVQRHPGNRERQDPSNRERQDPFSSVPSDALPEQGSAKRARHRETPEHAMDKPVCYSLPVSEHGSGRPGMRDVACGSATAMEEDMGLSSLEGDGQIGRLPKNPDPALSYHFRWRRFPGQVAMASCSFVPITGNVLSADDRPSLTLLSPDSYDAEVAPSTTYPSIDSLSSCTTEATNSSSHGGSKAHASIVMMPDGGPPSWALMAVLQPPPGLRYYDHCKTTAPLFGETALRMIDTGRLQHLKTLAILRTWDFYNHKHGIDISCGASAAIVRVLALRKSAAYTSGSGESSESVGTNAEQPVEWNDDLLAMDRQDALDQAHMPSYVSSLQDGGDSAVGGYVYCSGQYRLWTGKRFADRFMTASTVNSLFDQKKILPCFLFGSFLAPNDRPNFYRSLIEYMLGPTREGREMTVTAEVMELDGHVFKALVRARYMVLNEGQYSCFALSFLQIPGLPVRFVPPTIHPSSIASAAADQSRSDACPDVSMASSHTRGAAPHAKKKTSPAKHRTVDMGVNLVDGRREVNQAEEYGRGEESRRIPAAGGRRQVLEKRAGR